jgi:hypothetical protein
MRCERLPERLVLLKPLASVGQVFHLARRTRNTQAIAMALSVHQSDLAVLALIQIPLDIPAQDLRQRPILRPYP